MESQEFIITGMNCHHCVLAIEKELLNVGIKNFAVKIGSAKVESDGSAESKNNIVHAIQEAGYKVV